MLATRSDRTQIPICRSLLPNRFTYATQLCNTEFEKTARFTFFSRKRRFAQRYWPPSDKRVYRALSETSGNHCDRIADVRLEQFRVKPLTIGHMTCGSRLTTCSIVRTMTRILITVGLPIAAALFVSSAPSNGILTGKVIETDISTDGRYWVLASPGADRTHARRLEHPLPSATVRACSLDRVLETQTDGDGIFEFVNVPTGTYHLVAGGRGWAPITVKGVTVGNTDAKSITIDLTMPFTASPCYLAETAGSSRTATQSEFAGPS